MADLPDIPKTVAAIIEQTNAFRASQKLAPVRPNRELSETARLYAEYLAKTGKFAHEADGRQPADRAKSQGYKFCTVAENLALHVDSRGFTADKLSGLAVEGWKNSPGHRANMVLPHVTEIGVGVARATAEQHPKYLSVQLFGRPDSFRYAFKVDNRSTSSVAYSVFGAKRTVEPRVVITHTHCDPGEIQFERAGSWLTGSKMNSRFETRDGQVFTLRQGAGGVVVELSEKKAPQRK